jgi:hypothetical protein
LYKIGDGPDTDDLETHIQRPVNQARPQFYLNCISLPRFVTPCPLEKKILYHLQLSRAHNNEQGNENNQGECYRD